jgi:AraC-like DNA-binding protein
MVSYKRKVQPSASLLYLDILFQTLKRHGIKKQHFLNLCEPDKHNNIAGKTRLPVKDIVYYWSKAIELTQCPTLGLEAGLHIHPSDYGIMSYVWMNCKNLREAAQLTTHYKPLMNNAFHAEIQQVDPGVTILSLELSGLNLRENSPLIEFDFASVLHLGRFLTEHSKKDKVKFNEVHFQHAPNAPVSVYEKGFDCTVKFEQKNNLIVVNDATLDLPVHSPNPLLRDSMVKMVDKLVTLELGSAHLSDLVSTYIEQNLSQGLPEAERTAKHFGFSLSTFKRHLQNEGTNYLELGNQVRREVAQQMLKEAHISLGEVAFLLGFANVSAFHRAFKRWFAITPNQYRNNQLK